jgi:hypothetical protein
LEILDNFCANNDAELDPSYLGDGSRGCVSVSITLPDSVKLPGTFLYSLLADARNSLGEDSPLCAYMLRHASIIKSGQQKMIVFPRLAAQV